MAWLSFLRSVLQGHYEVIKERKALLHNDFWLPVSFSCADHSHLPQETFLESIDVFASIQQSFQNYSSYTNFF